MLITGKPNPIWKKCYFVTREKRKSMKNIHNQTNLYKINQFTSIHSRIPPVYEQPVIWANLVNNGKMIFNWSWAGILYKYNRLQFTFNLIIWCVAEPGDICVKECVLDQWVLSWPCLRQNQCSGRESEGTLLSGNKMVFLLNGISMNCHGFAKKD
jgi:hypothetical protein